MFGYVVANVDALSAFDKERYRAVYCGLCKALGQEHGRLGRLTLTYDMTFLILLLSSLDQMEFAEIASFRCMLHPLQKRDAFINKHTRYVADMNVMLAYHQRMDDWEDDRKASAFFQAKALGNKIEALKEKYPKQTQAIVQGLATLSSMESDGETNPDLPAAVFGSMLGMVFVPEGHENAAMLYDFGDKLGRFIYLMDAAVDLKTDLKKMKYNPLIMVPSDRHFELLQMLMADCVGAYEALPIIKDKKLMDNILYSGVWSRFPARRKEEGTA
ncbi:MAG: hypothetical protein GXZ04_04615 [Clostridiales bacterium]|nr:hypothetical protein [Clostridiales bacterium]